MTETATATTPAAPRHPVTELLGRYKAILQAAWQARHELAGPKRLADEAAFLPAALSLQETPVHPAPRRASIAICALFTIALIWSIVGEVDRSRDGLAVDRHHRPGLRFEPDRVAVEDEPPQLRRRRRGQNDLV